MDNPVIEIPEIEEKISIQLGDIIKLIAPTDSNINNHTYFVKYLDKTKLILVEQNAAEYILSFDETGKLDNEAITGIEILSRADSDSYAIQHKLTPGTWIDVYFGGDVPVVFTGKITNLEEDMIEITTHPENDVIYIDFGYKGIPQDLPIEKILIREPPTIVSGIEEEAQAKAEAVSEVMPEVGVPALPEVEEEYFEEVPTTMVTGKPIEMRTQIRDLFLTADQIKIGTELEAITQEVEVPEAEQRFGIDKQTNDLLDELLSTIPNIQRTENVLNNIHKMIERFKQLRSTFSKFDENGNALMPNIQGADFKPLVETLQNFNQKLYWILPVARNKKKLYDADVDIDIRENNTDIVPLTLAQSRIEEQDIIDRYYEGDIPDGENKYAFLIKSMNPYLTPYNVPTYAESDITSSVINTNITAIIDNLDDFYSSVAKGNEELSAIKRRRFVIQQYNLGMSSLEMNKIKGGDLIVKRKKLTNNDTLTLKSMLTLPEVTVRFSRVNMPSTNVLIKSNLNRNYLNYWKILKRNTAVSTTIIDNLEKPVDYDAEKFLSDIKEFILDETITDTDKYKKYLEAIVPKTRILFNLIKPFINGKLSIYDVLSYLEPFMIYQKDLSFMQYKEINEFIENKIIDYKKSYIANSKTYSTLNNFKRAESNLSNFIPNLVKLFESNQSIQEKVLLSYGIDLTYINLSDSEFLKKINDIDTGILYNNAISLNSTDLMVADGIQNIFLMKNTYTKNKNAIKESATSANNPCNKYKVIAKHYIEIDELEDDNDKEIYFDKKYDTTYYELINEYKLDKDAPLETRVETLTKKLMEKNGLSENDARRDAQAMINGKRIVEDGDYAILEDSKSSGKIEFIYFKRDNGKWIVDETISEDMKADTSKMFCNLNEKCIEVKGDCLLIDEQNNGMGETALKNNNIKSMIDEIDPYSDIYKAALIKNSGTGTNVSAEDIEFTAQMEENMKNIYNKIKEEFDNSLFRIGTIANIKKTRMFRYDEQKFKIGMTAEENVSVISPYVKLRDAILGQGDFVKRQINIIYFTKFTREANVKTNINLNIEGETEETQEDPYWYYCIKTNTKLMPTFLVRLANAFIKNESYSDLVERICAEQGTINDDGDAWVDKYSGYIIRNINLIAEEEYTEAGFKAITRSVMEVDLGLSILQMGKSKRKFDSPEAEKVSNIVSAVAGFIGINIESQKEFIIRNTIKLQGRTMQSKEVYAKYVAAQAAKGKKNIDDYETAYNSLLIILSLCYLLISIQISIPSVKTRKTFPGCIRSFVGFPMGGAEDLSAITYIACIVNKIKSSTDPWNSIQKMKVTDIVKKMVTIITSFILQDEEVQLGIKEKQQYLQLNPNETIPEEHTISKWINFLPPLQSIKLNTIQDVTDAFRKEFLDVLRKGSPKQHEMMNIMRSKIIRFSLGIIDLIQKTVHKKTAIMTNSIGEPYLENACCDDGETKMLQYFINAQPDIVTYNNNVIKLGNVLDDIIQMQKAGMYFDPTDTKYKFPVIKDEFSEETIYQAFIVFCRYGSAIPISSELRSVCMEKPENFNENDSLTENIRKLKRDGRNYSTESLEQLLNIVNSNNIVKLNVRKAAISNIQVLRDILTSMDERDVANIPAAFRVKFLELMNNFEMGSLFEDTVEMRNFKNYLAKTNETMLNDIREFIKNASGIKKSDIKSFNECIEFIADFEETGDNIYIERADETIYKMVGFIKNSLRTLTREFPNIIINKVDNTHVTIPRHWKLSDRHNNDIVEIIKKHYSSLNEYYNDTEITLAMKKMIKITRDTDLLAKNTLFFAPIQVGADKYMYSVFDRRLTIMLFKFYFYSVFTDIISLKDDDEILIKTVTKPLYSEDETTEILSVDAVNEKNNGDISVLEIIRGEKKELSGKIAKLLVVFSNILCNDKNIINYNYKSLMERVLRAKEKEKDIITNYLKEMTDEEREVENIFKNNKLEKWSKGLQKGLFSYDKDTYDEERDIMEQQAITEMALDKRSEVTNMNRDIYALDMVQEEANGEDIDNEETRITYLGEDAEYEDYGMDGDEEFY